MPDEPVVITNRVFITNELDYCNLHFIACLSFNIAARIRIESNGYSHHSNINTFTEACCSVFD